MTHGKAAAAPGQSPGSGDPAGQRSLQNMTDDIASRSMCGTCTCSTCIGCILRIQDDQSVQPVQPLQLFNALPGVILLSSALGLCAGMDLL